MKLSKIAIADIDKTLILNGIVYEDIKLELIDHIATEIETKMAQNFDYEIAFEEVFENWKPELRMSTSFWIGRNVKLPKILLEKYISTVKKRSFPMIVLVSILSIILFYFVKNQETNVSIANLKIFLRTLLLIETLMLVVCKYFIWKSKKITSFGYMFNKLSYVFCLMPLMIGFGIMQVLISYRDFQTILINVIILSVYIIFPIFYLKMAYQHFLFNKKNQELLKN